MTAADTRLYLDANATTPPEPAVVEAVSRALAEGWGNPSSPHAEGRAARRAIDDARESVAELLGAAPRDLIWTSGGTESLNTWLHGTLAGAGPDAEVVTTTAEHPAVGATLTMLEETAQVRVRRLPPDALGRVQPSQLAAALAENPATAIALIAAHNETGGVQPLAELADIAAAEGVPLLADGVQWTGKLPVELDRWAPMAWAVSFHKLGGPKGVGALVAPAGQLGRAWLTGGPQERRRRAGTENVPGIVGAGEAARLARTELADRRRRWQAFMQQFDAGLAAAWPGAEPLRDRGPMLDQTRLVRFPGVRGAELVQRLDLDGIAVSTGSACSSGMTRASAAARALGASSEEAEEYVRFSLPPAIAPAAVARLLAVLADIQRNWTGT